MSGVETGQTRQTKRPRPQKRAPGLHDASDGRWWWVGRWIGKEPGRGAHSATVRLTPRCRRRHGRARPAVYVVLLVLGPAVAAALVVRRAQTAEVHALRRDLHPRGRLAHVRARLRHQQVPRRPLQVRAGVRHRQHLVLGPRVAPRDQDLAQIQGEHRAV